MKKKIILFLILVSINLVLAEQKSLSPSGQSNISIAIDSDFPVVEILSPQNTTYNNQIPILVNFTIIELTLDTIWYSLNYIENISILLPFYLNLSEDSYILTIYANDSLNRINFSEVVFTINNTAITCGDSICSSQESCSFCSEDCGACPSSGTGGNGDGGGGTGTIPSPEEIEIPETTVPEAQLTDKSKENQTQEKPKIPKTSEKEIRRINYTFLMVFSILLLLIIISIAIYLKTKRKKKSEAKRKK